MRSGFIIFLLCFSLSSTAIASPDKHEQWEACHKGNKAICTALIESNSEGTADLAVDYSNRADIFYVEKNYVQALENYNQALKLEPNNSVWHINRGNVYARKGSYEQALEDYNQVLQLEPNATAALNNRAAVFVQLGKYQEALNDYDKVIKTDPIKGEFYCSRSVVKRKVNDITADSDAEKAKKLGITADCTR